MFPAVAQFLRRKGFDAENVFNANLQGCDDNAIFAYAQQEKRVIVTFDKHFADVLRYPPSSHCGIIRIRIEPPMLAHILTALDLLFNHRDVGTFEGKLIVLDRKGFRTRQKP